MQLPSERPAWAAYERSVPFIPGFVVQAALVMAATKLIDVVAVMAMTPRVVLKLMLLTQPVTRDDGYGPPVGSSMRGADTCIGVQVPRHEPAAVP